MRGIREFPPEGLANYQGFGAVVPYHGSGSGSGSDPLTTAPYGSGSGSETLLQSDDSFLARCIFLRAEQNGHYRDAFLKKHMGCRI